MKNKNYHIIAFLLLFSKITNAQNIERQVVSSNGKTIANNDVIFQQTIGQVAVKTLTTPNNVITQGFQQSEINIVRTEDFKPEFEFSFFPNPSSDFIQYKVGKGILENTQISLFSTTAQLLFSVPMQNTGGNIDVSALPDGSYILTLSQKNKTLKSFQVIKITK